MRLFGNLTWTWAVCLAIVVGVAEDFAHAAPAEMPRVGQWERFEQSVPNKKTYDDPYRDVTLDVVFTRPDGTTLTFWGFYDGPSTWRWRCMPDQIGTWHYEATFSDGQPGIRGAFECTASTVPGVIGAYEPNPIWFGHRNGGPFLMRSFHCGDRFFAKNWDDPFDSKDGERRARFLDWAQSHKYNTLSIASHYLNRDSEGRGRGWETPDLWPPNPDEFRRLESILDDLARRRIIVFPFAGFFGRDSDFPRNQEDQEVYLRYTLARIGVYWNLLFNVGGPEPLLRGRPYLSRDEVVRLGGRIDAIDVFDHALTVHNATGDDRFRDEPWLDFGTLQGPKTTNREKLAAGLHRNHHPSRPLYAQETLWPGNIHGHPDYSDDDIRRNAYVILFSGAMLNFGDMNGNSSSGFSNSMDPAEADPSRHAIIGRVWNTFASLPWATMFPRPDLVDRGYCLASAEGEYLVYFGDAGSVRLDVDAGPFTVRWINTVDPIDRRDGGVVSGGQTFICPSDGEWILHLAAAGDEVIRFEAEDGHGDWSIISTPTGKGISDPGHGSMRYELHFDKAGRYYVFLLAKQGPRGRDKENDVLLSLEGEKLFGCDGTTRPDGMRSYGDWKWTKLPKGPGHHTPDAIRDGGVYFRVSEPGVYTFEIVHRSENFAIDRVVMKRNNPRPPKQ